MSFWMLQSAKFQASRRGTLDTLDFPVRFLPSNIYEKEASSFCSVVKSAVLSKLKSISKICSKGSVFQRVTNEDANFGKAVSGSHNA